MAHESTIICKIKHLLHYAKFSNLLNKERKYSNLINKIDDLNYIYWNKDTDLQNLSIEQIIVFVIECSFNSKLVFFDNRKHACFFDIVDFARIKNPQCKQYGDIFETLNIDESNVIIYELRELIRNVSSESFESKTLHYLSYLKTVADSDTSMEIYYNDDGYQDKKNKTFDLYISKFTELPITNKNKKKLDELRKVHEMFPEIIGKNIEEKITDSLKELDYLSKLNLNDIIDVSSEYSKPYNDKYFLYFKIPDEMCSIYLETNEIFASKGFYRTHDEDHGREQNYIISKLNVSKFFKLAIKLNNVNKIEFPSNRNQPITQNSKHKISRESALPAPKTSIKPASERYAPKVASLISNNKYSESAIEHLSDEINF
jgi:hypothetical protein